ncbi:MAG: N-acetyltransferase [Solirubrobacterales bacterium]|nr:N-acetyltransferase [Solirubrobacterales bacterium]
MIRHGDPRLDGAACATIYAPYVAEGAASFEEVPPDGAEMGRRIETAAATHAWLVLESGGRPAGFAYGGPHRSRPAYRWACEVSVYVSAEHHRQGIGGRLYEALFGLLRRQGLLVACAGITLPNEASLRLHRALGFEPVGTYEAIGWKQGRWHDVSWWRLALAEPATPPTEPLGPQRL